MFARGKELDHWNEMVANQRDQVTQWHGLVWVSVCLVVRVSECPCVWLSVCLWHPDWPGAGWINLSVLYKQWHELVAFWSCVCVTECDCPSVCVNCFNNPSIAFAVYEELWLQFMRTLSDGRVWFILHTLIYWVRVNQTVCVHVIVHVCDFVISKFNCCNMRHFIIMLIIRVYQLLFSRQ